MANQVFVTLDQKHKVFFNGNEVGEGEVVWRDMMRIIPLDTGIEEIRVRDESNPFAASEWTFTEPYSFEHVDEAIEWFPAKVYVIEEEVDELGLRNEEKVSTSRSLYEKVMETKQRLESGEPTVVEEEEAAEEEEVVVERDAPLEDAEHVDWKIHEDEEESEEALVLREVVFAEKKEAGEVTALPRGVTSGQIYLPGERLQTQSLAEKQSRLKINKQRSKVPYVVGLILALVVGSFFLVRWIAMPDPTQYTAFCVDSRTNLVTENSKCEDTKSGTYVVAWGYSNEVAELESLDILPPSATFKEPKGNVTVTKNF